MAYPLDQKDFDQLPVRERMTLLMDKGIHVGADPDTLSIFYLLFDFHVEVRLKDDRLSLLDLRSFVSGEAYERMVDCRNAVDFSPSNN